MDVEVVLGVEEHELIASRQLVVFADGANGAEIETANLVFAAEEVPQIVGKLVCAAIRSQISDLSTQADGGALCVRHIDDPLGLGPQVVDGSAEPAACH